MTKLIRILRPKAFRLSGTRFGAGYWTGAVCSTLLGLLITFPDIFDSSDDDSIGLSPGTLLFFLLLLILAGIMITGILLSAKDFQNSRRLKDSSMMIGSILGLLLNSWPFVYCVASWAAYHISLRHS